MKDLAIALDNRPGALAEMGDALGRAGVSIEGGGAFVVNGKGVAHFLFADGTAARNALEAAGITVIEEREVLIQRLNQAQPGQLGKITRRMAEAGVNIEVLYSDHDHQLILVVDDIEKGRAVSEAWRRRTKSVKFGGTQCRVIGSECLSSAFAPCYSHQRAYSMRSRHAAVTVKAVRLNKDFTLRKGQRVTLKGSRVLAIKFVAVESDSRCPKDVNCVWAGNAAVQVQVSTGRRSKTLTLNTRPGGALRQ